ncbi:RRM domain-containing protein [Psidium guajava]|nr:RRM domain-containing protein [Psidium guajava]
MALVPQDATVRDGSGVSFQYPQLTATNYTTWAIKVEVLLDAQGFWEAVAPAEGAVVEARKDKATRAHLLQVLPKDILLQVATKRTAKELWDSLKMRFVGADRVKSARLATLRGEFDVLRMKDGETLDEYAGKLSSMLVRFANLGATLEGSALVKKLLDTVPYRFYPVVVGIEQFCDIDAMAFEEAVGRLKTFEERLRQRTPGGNSDGQLLLTESEWRARKKNGCESSSSNKVKNNARSVDGNRGRGGRGRDRGRGRGSRGDLPHKVGTGGFEVRGRDKSHIKCFNCERMGHYASECRTKKRENEAHLMSVDDTEPALMLAVSHEPEPTQHEQHMVMMLNKEKVKPELHHSEEKITSTSEWYLDNGASNHMTGDKAKFQELDEGVTGRVRFGDGSSVQIMGKGSVLFSCKDGSQWLLQETYYIPRLCSNIISLGQLTECGHKVIMDGGYLQVYNKDPVRLLMSVMRSPNRLYKINLQVSRPICLLISLEDPAWLWHARLGHVNFNALRMLAEKDLAVGVPLITHPNKLCQGCLIAKQVRLPFSTAANYRAEEPLELLHVDLCEPISPPTISGNNYFMLIVDDNTRWMWVYMIKTKDQAYVTFKNFKQLVENTSRRRVKTLRTDRGGEFLSEEFVRLCEESGILRHLTAPYSPQQNGVVERKNRTVMATARSLLKSMSVPSRFWGEAMRHAVYLLNRLPTKALGTCTPFEAWNGRKPHLAHLRVFGCTAHVKVTTPYLKKLDDRSQVMVYLGVEEGCKAHRLYDPHKRKLHVSRDVKFEEEVKWSWGFGTSDREESDFVVEETFAESESGNSGSYVLGTSEAGTSIVLPSPLGTVSEGDVRPTLAAEAHVRTTVENTVPPGPVMRAHARAAATMTRGSSGRGIGTDESVSPAATTPTSPSSSADGSDDGPVRYKSVFDLLQETRKMELQDDEVFLLELEEPSSYEEAAGEPRWEEAMKKEIESIEKNATWTLTELPAGQKPIGLKWVYKLKRNSDGEVVKHKARLVAKGFVQRPGIDFDEVFTPVAKLDTVRLILAIAANRCWEVHHLDVKSAFLHGELEEEVYVKQPEGFVVEGKEHCVYKLSKALYGLRQAPRAWNTRLDKSLKRLGFTKCAQDQAVYTRGEGRASLIVGVYVDDLIVTGEDPEEIVLFKQQMMKEFEMSDLGLLTFYLGIEVAQGGNRITLKQSAYAKKVLDQFGMAECNPTKFPMEQKAQLHKDPEGEPVDITEYRRIIGCLRYLLHTRPDLSYAVGVASRFMERPTVMHHKAAKQIMRYLKGTIHCGLVYVKGRQEEQITGYSDSNLAGDHDDRKSTGGMAFYVNENLVTWASQKQKTMALSSCEAEFMAATAAACQALWLRSLLEELTGERPKPVKLFVDNKSAIALMKNPVFHGRSKYIDTRFHFIRECVESREIIVEFVCTEEQKADALTKALSGVKTATMRHLLGVRDLGPRQD